MGRCEASKLHWLQCCCKNEHQLRIYPTRYKRSLAKIKIISISFIYGKLKCTLSKAKSAFSRWNMHVTCHQGYGKVEENVFQCWQDFFPPDIFTRIEHLLQETVYKIFNFILSLTAETSWDATKLESTNWPIKLYPWGHQNLLDNRQVNTTQPLTHSLFPSPVGWGRESPKKPQKRKAHTQKTPKQTKIQTKTKNNNNKNPQKNQTPQQPKTPL